MDSISFIGTYSGIDKTSIEKLMEVEKLPLVGMSQKKTSITSMQNAWKDINTRLKSLFDKIKVLQNPETYTSKAATSTDDSIIGVSAGKNAVPAQFTISVNQLAKSTRMIGVQLNVENSSEDLGLSGAFKIVNADGVEHEVEIEDGDTLTSVMEKINEGTKETSIRATVIDKRLVLEDAKTGVRTIGLENVDGKDSVLEGLGLDAGKEVQNGQNAKFEINGISIERDSNTVTDAVDGLTINLKKTHATGEYETVNIKYNTEKSEAAIKEFVEQYNSALSFIEEKMAAGTPGVASSRGVLAGDSSLQRLHSTLRQMVTSSISNENTTFKDISALGIKTTDKSGKLTFDAEKLREAMTENTDNVASFFASEINGKETGFVSRINSYIDSFISTTNGIIKGKNDSFERTLKDLDKQIETFNKRVEKKEQYYVKMFSALDVAMMQAESQMQWLVGQIDAMNASSMTFRR
ncbi:MAG: flagellar filament capping protein FliD [Gudongella sp.]|jgi:flagellar hook-associated protein 2|nr:flagellar filament capping protein FliD [Gudongella sp.]